MDILKQGVSAALPICLGYIPIGLAFGVIAGKAGLGLVETGFMSMAVYAGSSQFIAISMLTTGAALLPIIMTTFVVNLRHLLMSSSMSVHLKKNKKTSLSLFSWGITDETFAVNMEKFINSSWNLKKGMVVNFTAYITWIISTVAGAICGQFVPDGAFGINYVLIAMFIGLLVFQLRGKIYVITGILSGGFAVIFSLILPGNIYIVAGSVTAVTLVILYKTNVKRFNRNSA